MKLTITLLLLQALGGAPGPPTTVPAPDARGAVSDSAAPLQPRLSDAEFKLGTVQAPVTVIEYLSPTCPYCAAFNRDTFPLIERDYISTGKVLWIVRELTTPPARVSASIFLLARCSGEAGYWHVIQYGFAHRVELLSEQDPRSVVKAVARAAGLSDSQAATCLEDEAAITSLNGRLQTALSAGIAATPTFIVNGRKLDAGDRLGGRPYLGGPMTASQFAEVFRTAVRTGGH